MIADLGTFQSAFIRDLTGAPMQPAASSLAQQPGFAVYRNTVVAACIDALAANYPTVRQVVGADWFRDAARAFVRAHPPRTGVLASYGLEFAPFLASFDPDADLPYLPGIADLDRCWNEAHLAGDAPALRAADFAALTPEQLGGARLVPHPAARWRSFETMPIYTLWRRHREKLPPDEALPWRGESALLTRPGSSVSWLDIPDDAAAFLRACAAARSFDEALGGAAFASTTDGLSIWLPRLIHAGAFTRIDLDPAG